ncbi:winged helix-turn-helix transcriptional regulator [Roseovarius sp.]|uniref:winged helix-turn-helix transcriptional regulator n=1 Tax=Roseovarius sp. TaxID=1486281 RepID=UPI003BAA6354
MTEQAKTPRLRYDEGCLAAHALNLIGDRWALLVVRELVFAPKRFQMIRAGLPGITASVLTGRLGQLVEAGVVAHDARLGIYSLTEAGHGLLPVLEALCRWALMVPGHDPSRFISPTALMISMGVNLLPEKAGEAVAGFDFGSEAFEMRVGEGKVVTRAVERPEAPFLLKGHGNGMASAVYGRLSLAELEENGRVSVRGDGAAAQRFVDMFGLRREGAAT